MWVLGFCVYLCVYGVRRNGPNLTRRIPCVPNNLTQTPNHHTGVPPSLSPAAIEVSFDEVTILRFGDRYARKIDKKQKMPFCSKATRQHPPLPSFSHVSIP